MTETNVPSGGSAFTRLEAMTAVAVVGVLGLALGLVAFVMPSSSTETQNLSYTQSGAFGYSADAPKESAYGPEGLSTGEPVLLDVVGPVTTEFDYKLSSDADFDVQGTAALIATVRLSQGLSRVFEVTGQQSFTGNRVSLSGTLPLAAMRHYAKSAQASFGDTGFGTSTITVQPTVTVRGTIADHPVKAKFAPELPFTLSDGTLTLGGSDLSTDSQGADKTLHPSEQGKVGYTTTVANTVPLLFLHPTVPLARSIGFAVAGLCLAFGLWLARPLLRGSNPANEPARIRTLYGAHIVDVDELATTMGPVAELTSIDALADLAKKYESMIMHLSEADGDAYLVWDNGMLFRYRTPRPLTAPAADVPPPVGAMEPPQRPLLTKSSNRVNGFARR